MMKQCPQCGETYETDYETKQQAKDNTDNIAIEQHMTGICSRECYMKYLGSYVANVGDIIDKFNEYTDTVYITIENVHTDNTIERIVDAKPVKRMEDGDLDHDISNLDKKIDQYLCFAEL